MTRSFLSSSIAALFLEGWYSRTFAGETPQSPLDMARILEARIAGGEGIMLPDPDLEIPHGAGILDLDAGAWPQPFLDRIGETDAALPGPLRMWINDDADIGPVADETSDIPGRGESLWNTTRCNYKDETVNGIGDLEDFFPVWLDISEAIQTLHRFDPMARITVCFPDDNAPVNMGATTLRKATEPAGFPDSASDGTSVVFIHGFRVDAEGARAWNAEMFKRLWQSGSNAKFHAFTWRGNDGVVEEGGLNYHANVVHAFETAAAFAATNAQSVSGSTTVIAHSLGNMVVCSAIQDHGFRPARYFMFNAAVPVEAFDATQWNTSTNLNPMLHEEWHEYPDFSWAPLWHQLFGGSDTRQNLTWIDRFVAVPDLTDLFNFYSTGDEVLSLFDTPDANGVGTITVEGGTGGSMTYHSWQKQERFKGRFGVDAWLGNAGTSWMGWGLSNEGFWEDGELPMYDDTIGLGALYGIPARLSPYTAQQAADATSDQLMADPVFRHNPESKLVAPNLTRSELNELLAKGVPALSGPVGSRSTSAAPQSRNENLNGRTGGASWPRVGSDRWSGWRHSDIKDVALPFVFGVFSDICGAMEDSQ